MTIVKKSFEKMLEEIDFKSWVRYDIISPSSHPELFRKVELFDESLKVRSKFRIPNEKYQRSIRTERRIDYELLNEIFYNCFGHGNNEEYWQPVSIKVFEGTKGCVMRIRDSGVGFDYEKALQQEYRPGRGCGVYHYQKNYYEISFEGNGSILNVKTLPEIFNPYFDNAQK
jgi:hypothetical protein